MWTVCLALALGTSSFAEPPAELRTLVDAHKLREANAQIRQLVADGELHAAHELADYALATVESLVGPDDGRLYPQLDVLADAGFPGRGSSTASSTWTAGRARAAASAWCCEA